MEKSVQTAIILISESSLPIARNISRELAESAIYLKGEAEGCETITSYSGFMKEHFSDFKAIVFIGALGICVRSIASCIRNKYTDPAVINVDSTGRFVISVLSGHIGGGNELTRIVAGITGGKPSSPPKVIINSCGRWIRLPPVTDGELRQHRLP